MANPNNNSNPNVNQNTDPVDVNKLVEQIKSKDQSLLNADVTSSFTQLGEEAFMNNKVYDDQLKQIDEYLNKKIIAEDYDNWAEATGKLAGSFLFNMAAILGDTLGVFTDPADIRLPTIGGAIDFTTGLFGYKTDVSAYTDYLDPLALTNKSLELIDNYTFLGDGEEFGNNWTRAAQSLRDKSQHYFNINTKSDWFDIAANNLIPLVGGIVGAVRTGQFTALAGHAAGLSKMANTIVSSFVSTEATGFSLAQASYDKVYGEILHNLSPELKTLEGQAYEQTLRKSIEQGLSQKDAEWEAIQAMKKTREDFAKENPELDKIAKTNAGKGADATLKAMAPVFALNVLTSNLYTRSLYSPKNILNKPTWVSGKEILREGGTEALEEGVLEPIAGDVGVAYGTKGIYDSKDLSKVIWDYENNSFNWENIYSAGLGFIGGAGTATLSGLPYFGDFKERKEQYDIQQEQLRKENKIGEAAGIPEMLNKTTTLMNKMSEVASMGIEAARLENEGKQEEANAIKSKMLAVQAYEAFSNGTTKNLIENYEKISTNPNTSPEVKTRALEAIAEIKQMGEVYQKTKDRFVNGDEVFSNRVNNLILGKYERELQNQILEKKIEASESVQKAIELGETSLKVFSGKEDILDENGNVIGKKDKVEKELDYDVTKLKENPYTNTKEREVYDSFRDYASNNIQSVRELIDLQNRLDEYKGYRNQNEKNYNKITSKEYQRSKKNEYKLTQELDANKVKLEELKGTDEFNPFVDNILNKYKGRVNDEDLRKIKRRLQTDNDQKKESMDNLKQEVIANKYSGDKEKPSATTTTIEEDKGRTNEQPNAAQNTIDSIARKLAEPNANFKNLSKEEQAFYVNNSVEIDQRKVELQSNVSQTEKAEVETVSEELSRAGNELLNLLSETSGVNPNPVKPLSNAKVDNIVEGDKELQEKKADIERRRPTSYIDISKDKKSSLETFRNEAKREWDGVSVITGDRMKNLYIGIKLFVEAYPEYKELLDRFVKKENGIIGITNNNLSFILNTLKKEGVTSEFELGSKINAKYDAELAALESGTKQVSTLTTQEQDALNKFKGDKVQKPLFHRQLGTNFQSIVDSLIAKGLIKSEGNFYVKAGEPVAQTSQAEVAANNFINSEFTYAGQEYQLVIQESTNEDNNKVIREAIGVIKGKIDNNILTGWRVEEAKIFGKKAYKLFKPNTTGISSQPDEVSYQPNELNENLSPQQLDKLKELVNDYAEIMELENNKFPTFEELVKSFIRNVGRKQAEAYLKALGKGWELNGYGKIDNYDAIVAKLFRDPKEVANELLKLGAEVTTEKVMDSPEEATAKLEKQIIEEKLEATKEPVGVSTEKEPIYDSSSNLTEDPRTNIAYSAFYTTMNVTEEETEKGLLVFTQFNETDTKRLKTDGLIKSAKLHDFDAFHAGTQLEIVVPEGDLLMNLLMPVRNENINDPKYGQVLLTEDGRRRTITFKEWLSNKIQEFDSKPENEGKNFEDTQEYWNRIPMLIRDADGDYVGMVKEPDWYNKLVFRGNIKEAQDNVRNIRKGARYAQEHGTTFKVEITENKGGVSNPLKQDQFISISDANPQAQVALFIKDKNGARSVYIDGKPSELNIINLDEFIEGQKLQEQRGKALDVIPLDIRRWYVDENGNPTYKAFYSVRPKLREDQINTVYNAITSKLIVGNNNIQNKSDKSAFQKVVDVIQNSIKVNIVGKDFDNFLNIYIPLNNTIPTNRAELETLISENKFEEAEDSFTKFYNAFYKNNAGKPYLFTFKGSIVYGVSGQKANILHPSMMNVSNNVLNVTDQIQNKLDYLKEVLGKHELSLSTNYTGPVVNISDSLNVTTVAETYNGYLKNNLQTNLKSINLGTAEEPKYITRIQPMIYYAPVGEVSRKLDTESATEVTEDQEEKIANVAETVSDARIEEIIPQLEEAGYELYGNTIEEKVEDVKTILSEANSDSQEIVEEYLEAEPNIVDISEFNEFLLQSENQIKWVNEYFKDDITEDFSSQPREIEEGDVKEMNINLMTINGLNTRHQTQLANYVSNKLEDILKEGKFKYDKVKSKANKIISDRLNANKKIISETLRKLKNIPNGDKVQKVVTLIDKYEVALSKINLTLDNIDVISEQAIASVAQDLNGKVVEGKLQIKEKTPENDNDENENLDEEFSPEEEGSVRDENYSKTSLQLNPKSNITSTLRRFMKGFKEVNSKTGLPKHGAMGVPLYVDFDTVFDTTMSILANTAPDFKTKIDVLKMNADKQPWIPQLIEKLENSSNEIKNQFVTTMTKDAITMEFVLYSFSEGNVKLSVVNANSFSLGQKVSRDWNNNLLTNSNLVNDYGEIQIGIVNELYDEYKSWIDLPTNLSSESAKTLSSALNQGMTSIKPGSVFYNEKLIDLLTKSDRKFTANDVEYRVSLNANNEIVITPLVRTVVNRAIGNYNDLTTEEQQDALNQVSKWLSNFGIEMSDNALDSIFRNGLYHQGKLVNAAAFFKESSATGGAIGLLADWLNKTKNTPIKEGQYLNITEKGNNPLEDSAINKTLASLQSRYSTNVTSTSFRVGKKSIFGFTLPRFMMDRRDELKSSKGVDLRDRLRSLSFSKHSLWLQFFEDGAPNPKWSFNESFDINDLSLDALKEIGKQIYKDNSITALSDIDHEFVKVGMFQADKGNLKTPYVGTEGTVFLRTARFFAPTMSDKSSMTLIKTLALALNEKRHYDVNEKNQFVPNKNISEILFTQMVLPEMERINNYAKTFKANGKQSDIKNYDKGAQMFLMLPYFNDLVITQEQGFDITLRDMMINPEVKINEVLDLHKDTILKEIQNYVSTLATEKIQTWKDGGFISVGKTGEIVGNKLLDTEYLSGIEGANNILERIEIAALDFEINQMLSNANMFMTMIGDPALYYKVDESQRSKSYTEKAMETFDNMGKRLASMIAPGSKLADSENEQYTQIFLADRASLSENIEFLTELLDNRKFDWKTYNDIKNSKSPSNDPASIREFELEKEAKTREFYAKYPNSNAYFDIESTDAQEYTTWQEHIHILEKLGRLSDAAVNITPEEIRIAKEMFASGTPKEQLTEVQREVLKKVLQPIKPVYTGQVYDKAQDVMRMMYIKSSSFPLIPQLTEGLEINKLKEALEDLQKEGGTYKFVRASYQSANKVGAKSKGLDIYGADGSIKNISKDDLKASAITLNRKDFKIQLDVPYKSLKRDEDTVSLGTQLTKLLFGNGMMEETGFYLNDNPATGTELEKQYTETFIQLANLKKQQLYDELGIDIKTNKPINVYETASKIQKILKEEAISRGYSVQDIQALELEVRTLVDKANNSYEDVSFKMPIWLSSNSDRFESLLNAIVNNRLVKIKMSGNSYIAGSEEGFRFQTDFKGVDKSKIVWTNKWNNQSLQAAKYDEDGNLLYAQVLAPSKFRKKDGTLIDLLEQKNGQYTYVTKTEQGFRLKEDMIDSEVRSLTSFRIPTSGHISASQIEIVGFLTQEQGDLMIVPKNFTKQKGLDFDVDKENTYQLWHQVDENGKITALKEGDEEKLLQNKIINIHKAVLSNPAKSVQRKINRVLSFDYAKEQAELINSWMTSSKDNRYFTPLSSEYQKRKLISAASGKLGTGAYSLDVTSHSLFQQANSKGNSIIANAEVLVYDKKDYHPYSVRFGENGKQSDGILGKDKTLDGDRSIAEVLEELQNVALDNEKEQIMGKVNLNSYTLDVSKALAMLGFDKAKNENGETNSIQFMFLSQPILLDYVKEMGNVNSNLAGFSLNKEATVINKLLEKYGDPNYELTYFNDVNNNNILSIDALEDQIKYGNIDNTLQLAVLNRFLQLKTIGQNIRNIQTAINTDSKGLSKSILENIERISTVVNLSANPAIENAGKLIGEIVLKTSLQIGEAQTLLDQGYVEFGNALVKPTTISGIFTVNALSTTNLLWANHFPYNSTSINYIFDELMPLISASDASDAKKAEKKRLIIKEIKKYLNTKIAADTLFENVNAQAERERLFFDRTADNKKSLASYIKENMKVSNALANNALLQRLEFDINKTGKPSVFRFNNTASGSYDEAALNNAIYELMELNINLPSFNDEPYNTRKLAQDLVTYSMLEGGVQEATQIAKFIPIKYLEKMGFTFGMSEINFSSDKALELFGINPSDETSISIFSQQFAQHNPALLPKFESVFPEIELKGDNKSFAGDMKLFNTLSLFEEFGTIVYNKTGQELDQYVLGNSTKTRNLPPFISLRVNGEYKIWKKIGDNYIQVPVLGTFGMSEYNNTSEAVTSLIGKEKPTNPITTVVATTEASNDSKTINQSRFGLGGQDKLVDIITKVSTSSNIDEYLVNLANQLLPHIDPNTTITVAPIENKGTYHRTNNAITISLDQAQSASDTELARTILKELVHSITDNEIGKYVYDDENGRMQLRTNNAPEHILALVRLFNQISKSPEFSTVIDIIKEKRRDKSNPIPLTPKEARVYYGGVDIYEFIEMMLTQPEFQRRMAQIPTTDGKKTILDLFKDFINKLFNKLGVKFKSDTVAAQAIENIFILIDEKGKVKKEPVTQVQTQSTTIQMQPANIEKIKAGIKTTTVRSESQAKQINIPIGQSAIVNFGGQNFKVTNKGLLTIEEAGGKETIIKSEGVKSEKDFMYQQTKDWVNGKGKLYVYEIAALQQTQPITTQVFTTKVDQFIYTYNPVTKQVIHNAKSGDKVETNETQINKVLAAYAKANNFETKVFNKQEYVKVNDKVLNVNTGSKVTQKEIVDLFTTQEIKPVSNPVKSDLLRLLKGIQDDINNDVEIEFADVNLGDFRGYPNIQEYFNNPYGVEVREYDYIKNNKDVVEQLLKELNVKDSLSLIDKLDYQIEADLINVSSSTIPVISSDTSIEEDLISQVESMSEMKNYELFPGVFANEEQTKALDKLDKFITSPRDKSEKTPSTFVLVGRGGTGKTTIVKKITEMYPDKRVVGAAISHSAKGNLSNSLRTNVVTLASMLGYKEEVGTGKFKVDINFDPSRSPISYADILVIDECSMIPKEMIASIYKYASPDAKIIFMGDNVQLPAIGEPDDSQTFTSATKPEYNAKLTQRMRQGETSPIVPLSDIIAANVEKPAKDIKRRIIQRRESNFNPITNKGVLFANEDQLFSELKKDLLADVQNTKIIGYTNELRDRMNDVARQMLWGEEGAKNEYNVGEILVANDIKMERKVPIINNEYYKVTNVIYNSEAVTVKDIALVNNKIQVIDKKLPGYKITAEILSEGDNFGKIISFNLLTKESKQVAEQIQNSLRDSKNWKVFYANKDYQINDIRYGYAITSHKSQGSTFNNVYVIEDNIVDSRMTAKEANQSLYVAVTRPRNKVVIYSKYNSVKPTQSQYEEVMPVEPPMTEDEISRMESTGESFQPKEVKPGVTKLFNENPELAKIGTQEQYSQYLNTIFPDSKVKDILYHGTPYGGFDKFEIDAAGQHTGSPTKGVYFTDSIKTATFYAEGSIDFDQYESREEYEMYKTDQVYSVLLNVKNLKLIDNPQGQEKQGDAILRTKKKLHDSGLTGYSIDLAHQYIVFDSEQIHILGSQQDIEGFKKFVEENNQSFQPKEFVSAEANMKAYLREKGVLDKYLKIIDINKFRTLHKELRDQVKQYLPDFNDKLFLENETGTKAYPNKAAFQKIDKLSGIRYSLQQSFITPKKTTPISLPSFNVNTSLQNKDGSKRFASTSKDGVITINPVTSVDEFFDYFEGKEGGITSQQKALVLAEVANQNWPIEKIKALLKTPDAINTFLVLHENSHVENKDQDVYWAMGKDLLTADKIAIEARATVDALVAMEKALPNKLDYNLSSSLKKQITETKKDILSSAIENQIDNLIRQGIIKSKCD